MESVVKAKCKSSKKISNNNWTELKNLSKDTNSFDCVVYDHFDDLSNTKIKLHLINKILNEGILVVLTAKENLEIFNKKALYIYIREMIDVKTPKITRIAQQLHTIFKSEYLFYLDNGYARF